MLWKLHKTKDVRTLYNDGHVLDGPLATTEFDNLCCSRVYIMKPVASLVVVAEVSWKFGATVKVTSGIPRNLVVVLQSSS